MINLLYFARLRETFGIGNETIELPENVRDVAGLLTLLRTRGGVWSEELGPGKQVRVAVDQAMAQVATRLSDGAEVAIFPPVTGG